MRKLLALLLATVMLFALAACGDEDVRGTYKDTDEDKADVDVSGETNDASSTPSGGNTDVNLGGTGEFGLGMTEAKIYENAFLGIACELPDDWTFYTDAQIRELNGLVGDLVGEEVAEVLENASVIYDMHAVADNEVDNMNVVLQNVGYQSLSQEDLRKSLEEAIAITKQGFENMGYTDVNVTVDKAKFCGQYLYGLRGTSKLGDVTCYQRQACYMAGKYMVAITATTYYEDTTQDILDTFYELQ